MSQSYQQCECMLDEQIEMNGKIFRYGTKNRCSEKAVNILNWSNGFTVIPISICQNHFNRTKESPDDDGLVSVCKEVFKRANNKQ